MSGHPMDHAAKYNRRRKVMTNQAQKLWTSSRTRAVSEGIPHTISVDDVLIPEFCPVLGYKLSAGGLKNDSPSIDRIIPALGYVPGNVEVISMRANRLKNNGTLAEFRKIVKYLEDR